MNKRAIPEEYEKDKQIILNAYKEGLPVRRIEARFGYTRYYISKIKNILISEGLITEEEISVASARYYKENPNAQGLNKTKVRKPKDRKKAEARHKKSLEKRRKVLELVKQGKSKTQIARELEMNPTTVSWNINILIEEGKIKKEDVMKDSRQADTKTINKEDDNYIIKIDRLVNYLEQGWKGHNIRKKLDITPYEFDVLMRDIKAKGIMTAEQIKLARERKRQEDLQFVANSVHSKLTISQMRQIRPEFSYNEITPMIRELIKDGIITQEEVDENKKQKIIRTMNSSVQMTPDEQTQFILDKIQQGYSPKEILDSDTTQSLSMHKILYQKRQLISKGKITQEEADRLMQERIKKQQDKKIEELMEKIKEYTEQGYSMKEIFENFIDDYTSYSYFIQMKGEYAKEHGWYTREELANFRRLRKKREEENIPAEERKRLEEEKIKREKIRQEEIIKRRNARKDKTRKKQLEDLESLKERLKNSKNETMRTAAEALGFSVEYAYKIRNIGIQNGIWLTEEELNQIKRRKRQIQRRNQKKRKQQQELERDKKKQENKAAKKETLWKFRAYVEQGYDLKEIAQMMNYSIPYMYQLKRKAIEDNIWFSEEAIEEFKSIRQKKEEKEKRTRQKREEIEQKREMAAAKKEMQKKKAMENERKQKIRGYVANYKKYKKMAKKEDRMEIYGEENVSIEGRKKLIPILVKLHALDVDISEQDIQIVLNALDMYPELADATSIKFLISDANKKGGLKAAEKMAIHLTNTLKNTQFYKPLTEYRRWIAKRALLPKIKELKEQGMSNTDIGERLGITSLEVLNILESRVKIKFPGEPEIDK